MNCHTDPVLTIEPVTEDVLGQHPAAKRMLVERYQDGMTVLCTDDECLNGIEAAARAFAGAYDAAYDSGEAS